MDHEMAIANAVPKEIPCDTITLFIMSFYAVFLFCQSMSKRA